MFRWGSTVKSVRVSNFRSFDDATFNLNEFNVLIGANASGKSNFICVFQFLKDIVEHGLDNAISMQGGITYLGNVNIGRTRPVRIELHVKARGYRDVITPAREKYFVTNIDDFRYTLAIQFHKRGTGYKVIEEELATVVDVSETDRRTYRKEERGPSAKGKITLKREKDRVVVETNPFDLPEGDPYLLKSFVSNILGPVYWLDSRNTFIESGPFNHLTYIFGQIIRGLSVYDFDPKICKEASPITGKTELEANGSNLAIVLQNILKTKENKIKFTRLLKRLLPFVEDLKVEKRADKSLLTNILETYSEKTLVPAPFISDGTINLIALIVTLYFETKPFVVIEEPERNIHPQLISRVVDMMKEVSSEKQIIVTTHNPEIVRHAGIEDLLLLRRNREGFSEAIRPGEIGEVREFLQQDMGLDDLYVENLLEL